MPPEPSLIRAHEERSMNAWPALQIVLVDGWVLRFANGYTRRANAVHPLYPATMDVVEKIALCERIYKASGQRTVFKMTAAAEPTGLDGLLGQRGYRAEATTAVQTVALDAVPAARELTTRCEGLNEAWLDAFARLSGIEGQRRETLGRMLAALTLPAGFFSIVQEGKVLACGLGVVQQDWIGLYDIVTDANFRGQGFGRRLLVDILAWGRSLGARNGYLQVMVDNTPALRLYDRLGFQEQYRYWYRVKE